jgi:NitT/TauT family transport system permease protein
VSSPAASEIVLAAPPAARKRGAGRRAATTATRQILLPVLAAAAVLLAWEAFVRLGDVSKVILPAPSLVASVTIRRLDVLLDNAVPTALLSVAGFGLSLVLGGLLGIWISASRLAREALYPNVILFQLIPKVAVAPLFMLWLGIGGEARVAIAFFVAFFPIVISTVSGLNAADPALLRLFRSLTASPLQIFLKVRLPSSLPFLFNGMKISMTLSIIGVIVGEFITSQEGLGYIILFAGSRLDTPLVMAAILVLCFVGLLLYGLVALAERIILARYGD